jgi:hypothetical protein
VGGSHRTPAAPRSNAWSPNICIPTFSGVSWQAEDTDVVELATDTDLPVASRPGLAPHPPAPQFPDDRWEKPLLEVQFKNHFDGVRFIFLGG